MRVIEILLPKHFQDKDLSPRIEQQIDMLQKRMNLYVDKIMDPKTSTAGREFLKARLRDEYADMKNAITHLHQVAEANKLSEAIHKLPLTNDDFEAVIKMMERPIPAAIAGIYIHEIIIDDELTAELTILEDTEPNRDIRPLIAEWFRRVMPDQMYRFTGEEKVNIDGRISPIHGYHPRNS